MRVLELNDERVFKFEGTLTLDIIEMVRCGLVRNLAVKAGYEDGNFDELVKALGSQYCMVHALGVDDVLDRPVSDLLTAGVIDQLAPRLKHLGFLRYKVPAPIPEGVFRCVLLESLSCQQSGITGTLSPKIGQLTNLKTIYTWGTQITGPIPKEICNLKRLATFTCYMHSPHTHQFYANNDGFWHVNRTKHPIDRLEEAFAAYDASGGNTHPLKLY